MALNQLPSKLDFFWRLITRCTHTFPWVLGFIFSSFTFLLLWRLWRFTIFPMIHPKDAKELPYWTPIVGHTFAFFMDSDSTFTRGRLYFQNSRKPFGITVAGTNIYVLTSAADAIAMSKNTKELVFDEYVKGMMASMGCSAPGIAKMWQPGRPSNIGYPNPLGKPLGQLSEEIFRKQLHPGNHLTELQHKFLSGIHHSLSIDSIYRTIPESKLALSSSQDGKYNVSLLRWTQATLLEGATNAFFGEALLRRNPGLLDNFSEFDERSWQLSYQIPRIWSKKMRLAKQKSLDALTAYFRSPIRDRPGACWLVQTMEMEMREVGIGENDMAANLMMAYWVINGNAWKVCFWMMAYLVESQELCSAIRNEITPMVSGAQSPNELSEYLDRCPQLIALYQETLRIVTSSVSVRTIVSQLELGGMTLQPGSRVLIPYRQILMDEEVFGPNAGVFDPTRFLKRPSLAKSLSFRPFGSGTTHCPGRFLAQKEVLTFIGVALGRFDIIKVDRTSSFPRLDLKKPCLGIMAPVNRDDVAVTVMPLP